ncbi:AraC family transcriptional regulator [Streptomyces lonegramiae]|uniref:AraC family transcriptional regulator n=1 Tax=Streptomyces lonegramiae TaxID=3075524 RepID=A0ABU2XVN7_9ACTN|nr:AraC family transcriptional regulator [Streptomyces sp. DSM 41529]MDT0549557.1 AraC family transcriptional regulator [Streptomyces sp. DSM 41529]
MKLVTLRLEEPPTVVDAGVGVHGVSTAHDVFRLPDLWQLHLYNYAGELSLGQSVHAIRPGHVSLVPPNTEVHFHYRGRSEHFYVHLRLHDGGTARVVPVMQDAAAESTRLADLLRHAVTAMPASPSRASAEVWAALWRIAELPRSDGAGRHHPFVAAAQGYIEEHLAGPLSVPDVARAVGISHTHLTRVFRAETGLTVVSYVRRRRLQHARHLLLSSTLSITAIAGAVGITDLQAFNKACRRELGASPRHIRAAGHERAGDEVLATSGEVIS